MQCNMMQLFNPPAYELVEFGVSVHLVEEEGKAGCLMKRDERNATCSPALTALAYLKCFSTLHDVSISGFEKPLLQFQQAVSWPHQVDPGRAADTR